ncbi:hypothetical protein [Flavobacterium sp. N1736]|uniref:hypothetical protein n=1 Tax=Flavobacterium sp. N1736 TaxID=2986823 RepID=UPI0022256458|nr:hypothetical protein [Flavobacterium sp. N1736]
MSDRHKLDEIVLSNKLGYRTYLYFICTDDELLAEIYQGTAFKFHTESIPEWFEKYVYNKFNFKE